MKKEEGICQLTDAFLLNCKEEPATAGEDGVQSERRCTKVEDRKK